MFNTIYDPYQNGKKKRLFRHIKSLRTDYCGLGALHKNGTNYTDNQMKSEILNEQFSSVFTRDDGSELPHMGDSPYQDISFVEFDLSGIATLLNDLNPTKSSGPDRIPTKLLKVLATEVSPCLQLLFSASLNQCTVPSECKKALICPLFKKGNRKDPSNYRPVSLTSVCSKVMEHIIYSNIMSHIVSYQTCNLDFGNGILLSYSYCKQSMI